ncbi:MAG: GTP-binding protein [Chitinophagaceae bacterium]|nr:GTP-binding protein [Chitinophagaceae bacterium]
MNILRFITAGSVDDGKSTLIGRLLYDSKSILTDQLEQLEKQSKNRNDAGIDLALLTDGLRAEREQGITIDVAYRYFSTPKRKFIIADAPGHVQYTRNMITGASNAELIIILIDARQGVVEQTRRHSIIASLLRIPHVVVAINKMDLMDFSQDVFNNIVIDYSAVANQLGLHHVSYFPISALQGDNIVDPSANMPWYEGPPLLQYLEDLPLQTDHNHELPRFQVQFVIRPQTPELHDYRGYAGRIASGIYRQGEEVTVLPSGLKSRIRSIEIGGKPVEEAFAPQSVVIQLEDDLDISRGDILVTGAVLPEVTTESEVLLCWMDEKPLQPGNKYILQHQSRQVRAMVRNLHSRVDVNTLQEVALDGPVSLNEIVKARIKTAAPLAVDRYASLRHNGAAILVDETSNNTVAALLFT